MLAEGAFERRAVIHRFGWVLAHIFNGSPSVCSGTGQVRYLRAGHDGDWRVPGLSSMSRTAPPSCDSKRMKSRTCNQGRSDLVHRNGAVGLLDCPILDRRGLKPLVHFHNLIASAFALARIRKATTYIIRSDNHNEACNHHGRSTGYN
jgi:hypothetical protein